MTQLGNKPKDQEPKVKGQWRTKKNHQSHTCFLKYPAPIYVSKMIVTSCNDVMIICFPPRVGKLLYMHSRVTKTGVAFSSMVCGGVQYTAPLAIQKCGCSHSTMGYGHFSPWTPIPEHIHTGQQESVAHTTVLASRESPLTHPLTLPHPAISQHNHEL